MFWHDDVSVTSTSFVGFMLLYIDENGIMFKSDLLIAYHEYVLVLNLSPCWGRQLLNNGHSEVTFLPVDNFEIWERFAGHDSFLNHGLL